ncbi:MAG: Hpt domain-containing protein [Candidatus Aminicenantes bacterium]|jgi:HPt (histidine-containing phosphotransfer) domain-containing protein|nr:Hpt domain-containing protein [Candidatus Aminicenantes bacterium]
MSEKSNFTPPINKEEALNRIGGEEDFLNELLDIYREEFEKRYAELEKAIAEGNFQRIREAGHSIKGASANLSLPALREAAYEMEMAGKNEDLDVAQKTLKKLKMEFERLQNFLGYKS